MRTPYIDPNFWNPKLPLKYAKAMRFGNENWEVKYGEPVTAAHRAFVGPRIKLWFLSKAVVYDVDAIVAAQRAPAVAEIPVAPASVRKSKYADVSAARTTAAAE